MSNAQDIVLSKEILKFYQEKEKITSMWSETINSKNPEKIKETIDAYKAFYNLKYPQNRYDHTYLNYADLLAKYGNLKEAVIYYELAFNTKSMLPTAFLYQYRKDFFKKDTVLYQKTLERFKKQFAQIYSYDEIEILQKLREIFSADQMAREYHSEHSNYRNCAASIIIFADTIHVAKIKELFDTGLDVASIFYYDFELAFVLGRHLFTAYPDFWLTYFEPTARQNLIEGRNGPQNYARTYDRAIITSGRAAYSYYGEWDNNGKNENPDTELVNRRRANLGLKPLGEEKIENKVFITY